MKNAIGLFAAFCLALIVAIFVYFSQKSVEQKEQIVAHQSKTVKVLVANADFVEGTRVDLNKFEWRPWPVNAMHEDYFRKENEAELKKLNGAVLRGSVLKGEPLKRADLLDIGSKSVVTAFVRPGMRGQVIPISKVTNPSAHFSPGDFVDVILPKSDMNNTETRERTIRGARIIAVDDKYSKEDDAEEQNAPKNITVEVTEPQAIEIASAMQQGSVTLSLYSAFTPPTASDGNPQVAPTGPAAKDEKHDAQAGAQPPTQALGVQKDQGAGAPEEVVILRGSMGPAGK